jgi:hypothetical protein
MAEIISLERDISEYIGIQVSIFKSKSPDRVLRVGFKIKGAEKSIREFELMYSDKASIMSDEGIAILAVTPTYPFDEDANLGFGCSFDGEVDLKRITFEDILSTKRPNKFDWVLSELNPERFYKLIIGCYGICNIQHLNIVRCSLLSKYVEIFFELPPDLVSTGYHKLKDVNSRPDRWINTPFGSFDAGILAFENYLRGQQMS